jgi:hypothetical protein
METLQEIALGRDDRMLWRLRWFASVDKLTAENDE